MDGQPQGGQTISPDLMKLMQGGDKSAGNMPPVSSSGSSPQENEGEKLQAHARVQMGMTLLEQSLSAFGAGSPEGQSILSALKALGGKFGHDREKGREIIPSEVMNLVGGMPGGAGGAPAGGPGGGMPPPPPGGGMPGGGATPPGMA